MVVVRYTRTSDNNCLFQINAVASLLRRRLEVNAHALKLGNFGVHVMTKLHPFSIPYNEVAFIPLHLKFCKFEPSVPFPHQQYKETVKKWKYLRQKSVSTFFFFWGIVEETDAFFFLGNR